ncbi:unnamed protein product [Vitrella brassicaformis CCMP3155]|uniref:Importin subunit alpha n=2 Tax=Vitrella brassicaformis TaxID=1169539 RepID=A0A0G4FBH6_VITBC|nr:unnamed protein product [Vitrella brassicaformis CCMP3155]|eukprot:CEM10276.1 unnamed protein product [Vitrella brassicaformis CCMP3155]
MESVETTTQHPAEQRPLSESPQGALVNASASALLDSIGTEEGYNQMVAERGLQAVEAEISAVMTQISTSIATTPDSTSQLLRPLVQLVSLRHVPCITQKAIDAGILPMLVERLGDDHLPDHQQQAASALDNIASGNTNGPPTPSVGPEMQAVIDAGAVPPLVELVSSLDDGVCVAAMKTLVNLARPTLLGQERGDMLQLGVLARLQTTMRERTAFEVLKGGADLLYYLCFWNPDPPAFDKIGPFVPVLANIICTHTPDQEGCLLYGAMSALAAISDGRDDDEHRDAVVATGVCERLVELAAGEWVMCGMLENALTVLDNIAQGTDAHRDVLAECGVIPRLSQLLQPPATNEIMQPQMPASMSDMSEEDAGCERAIRLARAHDKACRVLTIMISEGTAGHVEAVVNSGAVPHLLDIMTADNMYADSGLTIDINFIVSGGLRHLKQAAAEAMALLANNASQQQVEGLVGYGCVQRLCGLLDSTDDPNVLVVLSNILDHGRDRQVAESLPNNPFSQLIREADVSMLVALQTHDDQDVAFEAMNILLDYFPGRVDTARYEAARAARQQGQQGEDDDSDGMADLDTDVDDDDSEGEGEGPVEGNGGADGRAEG